jgi:hypothetical protein
MEYKNGVLTKVYDTDCKDNKLVINEDITKIDHGALSKLNLKEVVLSKNVTEISSYAFFGCENLESITLPSGLKSIGERSFAGCKSLKRIVLPEGITSIDAAAFAGCESLEEIILPSTIKEIKYRTLSDCKNLKRVVIPDSVQKMEWGIFSGCENLEVVNIPDSVTNFGYQMFLNCKKLKKVLLPHTLTTLPDETFMGCSSLEDYFLPIHITSIGKRAFYGCKRLKHFPEHVIKFGEESFRNCKSLVFAKINDGVVFLPDGMFQGCIKLNDVICEKKLPIGERTFKSCLSLSMIPSFVQSYNKFAFENCYGLKEITITDDHIPEGTFRGCKNLVKIIGSNKIIKFGSYAFAGCENLQHFECSNNLLSLPASVFEGCKNLISFIMTNNIIHIGDRAFFGCEKLPELTLSLNLHSIGQNALSGCNSIKRLCIPPELKKVASGALSYMKSLSHIEVDPNNKTYSTYDNLSLIHNFRETLVQYAIGSDNKKYSIEPLCLYIDALDREVIRPLKRIGFYAFAGAENLEELTLLSSLQYLEKSAFENCPKLKSLLIKTDGLHSVLSLNVCHNFRYAFDEGDFPFEKVYVGNNVLGIHTSCFSGFRKLKNIHLPNERLQFINNLSFTNCNGLQRVFIPSGVNLIQPQSFPESTILKFENGLEITYRFFHDLQTREGMKIYTLKNDTYYIEKNNLITTLSKKKIAESCTNANYIVNNPETFLNYIELMKKHGKKDKTLMNGFLMASLKTNIAETFIKEYDNYSEKVIVGSEILSNSESAISKVILETPQKLIDYISIAKKYNIRNQFLTKGAFIAALNKEEIQLLIESYNANLKRLINTSEVLSNPNTAVNNMKDLFKLGKILGAFEKDPIVRQRACTFLTEKVFAEHLTKTKKNDCQIVGDNIHRKFTDLKPREIFEPQFANFFMKNYKELCAYEKKRTGFLTRVYNSFLDISKTNTSDRGNQRQLLVTVEKCHNYFLTRKFTGITPENQEVAQVLGEWFDEDQVFQNGIQLLEEAKAAPRNIFTKFIINEEKQLVFNNDSKNDLVEPLSRDFSYEWLNKQSIKNLILGKYCDCCAHINAGGKGITRASMISPDCQNLVIKNELNEIIAKSTIYVNRLNGYAVFNNVESSAAYRDCESSEKIYRAFIRGAAAFLKTYNDNNYRNQISLITVGTDRNTILTLLEEKDDLHPQTVVLQPLNYRDYAIDSSSAYNGNASNNQRVLLKKHH